MTVVLTTLLCVASFMIGWSTHIRWVRSNVYTAKTGDGQVAVVVGRAVAGIWNTAKTADRVAGRIRGQVGGKRTE